MTRLISSSLIAARIVHPSERPSVPLELLDLFDAAEGASDGDARVLGGQAPAPEIDFEEREV